MLQAGRSRAEFRMGSLDFNLPKRSITIYALGSTQPLTEMSIRNPPGGKGWPALFLLLWEKSSEYKNGLGLTAVCESIV
jgi:hypothetical protein